MLYILQNKITDLMFFLIFRPLEGRETNSRTQILIFQTGSPETGARGGTSLPELNDAKCMPFLMPNVWLNSIFGFVLGKDDQCSKEKDIWAKCGNEKSAWSSLAGGRDTRECKGMWVRDKLHPFQVCGIIPSIVLHFAE